MLGREYGFMMDCSILLVEFGPNLCLDSTELTVTCTASILERALNNLSPIFCRLPLCFTYSWNRFATLSPNLSLDSYSPRVIAQYSF